MPVMRPEKIRRLALVSVLAVLATGAFWCGWESIQAARQARIRTWTIEAEEIGGFVKAALERGNDLLVVERFARLLRRDDIAYVLVMDREGKAFLHMDGALAGKVYTSDIALRALATADVLVQMMPSLGLVEVDFPLGSAGVLRAGFVLRTATAGFGWMCAGLVLALAGLFASVLLPFRATDKLLAGK